MYKLMVFLLMLGLGAPTYGMESRPEKPLVVRYPVLVDSLMYRLSSCKGVEDMAREIRGSLEPVSANKYTQFFQNAQREVGVKEADILPIKICDDLGLNDAPGGIAVTHEGEIRVFSKKFDQLPYGAQRATALHESLHHKYHDQTKHRWLFEKMSGVLTTTSCLATVGLWARIYAKSQSRFRIGKAIAAPFAAFFLGAMITTPIVWFFLSHNHAEFRADRDAMELLKCYKCAKDNLECTSGGQYLTSSEVKRYCNHYEKKGLLCDYHTNCVSAKR